MLWRETSTDSPHLGGVITELRLLLMSEFVQFRMEVCPRSCNKVADALAAFGCKYPSDDQITWGMYLALSRIW